MSHSLRALALSLAGLISVPVAASAETLFSDNFEIIANGGNDTENTNAVAPLPELNADIGKYSAPNTNGRVAAYGASTENPITTSVPVAPTGGGSHGLRLQPPSGGGRTVAFLSQPASVLGSTFTLEFDAYVTNNFGIGFGSQNRTPFEGGGTVGLANPGKDRPRQSVNFNLVTTGGNPVNIFKDSDNNPATANVQVATGLTFTPNAFQHFKIDYVLGSTTLTLKVGTQDPVVITNPFQSAIDSDFDNTNGLTPQAVTSLSQVAVINFATGTAGTIGYVDNIVVTGTAFAGDANQDLRVDTLDFNLLAGNFGLDNNASWIQGDFNADNKVDSVDFGLLVGNFGASIAPPAAPLGSAVPEPASGLAVAGLLLLGRIRRFQR